MRFRVQFLETFDTGFQKLVPPEARSPIRLFIERRLSRAPRDGSVLWPPSAKELRTDAIYIGGKVGYLRILFEIAGDDVIVWSIAKGRLPDV